MVITMTETRNHDLNFMSGSQQFVSSGFLCNVVSGMISTWNKLCFTTGYIEMSVSMPGTPDAPGLWPAAWTMGNLGRAGYGATTEGTPVPWPSRVICSSL
jgi:beta-glucanase (GH16 family)